MNGNKNSIKSHDPIGESPFEDSRRLFLSAWLAACRSGEISPAQIAAEAVGLLIIMEHLAKTAEELT